MNRSQCFVLSVLSFCILKLCNTTTINKLTTVILFSGPKLFHADCKKIKSNMSSSEMFVIMLLVAHCVVGTGSCQENNSQLQVGFISRLEFILILLVVSPKQSLQSLKYLCLKPRPSAGKQQKQNFILNVFYS